MTTMPPGWYDDRVTPGMVRWFDGTAWAPHTAPVPSPAGAWQVAPAPGLGSLAERRAALARARGAVVAVGGRGVRRHRGAVLLGARAGGDPVRGPGAAEGAARGTRVGAAVFALVAGGLASVAGLFYLVTTL